VMDMFLHPPVTDEYTFAAGHPDPEGIRKMLCDGYDFSVERVDKAMEGFTVKAGQKTLERWF
jgi:flap endonuclease-1